MPRTRGGAHGRLWEGGGGGAGAEGRGGAGAEGRAGGRRERLQPELSAASAASAARAAVHGPDGRRAARTRTRTPASGLSGPRGAATLSWAWDWLADLLHGSDVSTAGWSRRAAGALLLADRDVSHRGRPRHQEGEPGRGARARAFHACLALRGVNGPCEARRGGGGRVSPPGIPCSLWWKPVSESPLPTGPSPPLTPEVALTGQPGEDRGPGRVCAQPRPPGVSEMGVVGHTMGPGDPFGWPRPRLDSGWWAASGGLSGAWGTWPGATSCEGTLQEPLGAAPLLPVTPWTGVGNYL